MRACPDDLEVGTRFGGEDVLKTRLWRVCAVCVMVGLVEVGLRGAFLGAKDAGLVGIGRGLVDCLPWLAKVVVLCFTWGLWSSE